VSFKEALVHGDPLSDDKMQKPEKIKNLIKDEETK
jgi:hypothetical protein